MVNNSPTSTVNLKLAEACQLTCGSCCKKGKIFLPEDQYQGIVDWVKKNSPSDLEEFESRLEQHDGFKLYDQKTGCQFLNKEDLCRLHADGVKPKECFWWPLHVYLDSSASDTATESNSSDKEGGDGSEDVALEIRAATVCCDAYKYLPPDSPYVAEVEEQARKIGGGLIKKFRKVFPGTYHGIVLRKFKLPSNAS
jgi:Fe-S-cluster containining protein